MGWQTNIHHVETYMFPPGRIYKKNVELASQLGHFMEWPFPKIDHWVPLSKLPGNVIYKNKTVVG